MGKALRWERVRHTHGPGRGRQSYLYSLIYMKKILSLSSWGLEIYSHNQNQVAGNACRKCGRSPLCLYHVLWEVVLCVHRKDHNTLGLKQPPAECSFDILLTLPEWWLASLALGAASGSLRAATASSAGQGGFPALCISGQWWQQWLEWE